MDKLDLLRRHLAEVKRDCLELRSNKDLTAEGLGMLLQIEDIEELLGEEF